MSSTKAECWLDRVGLFTGGQIQNHEDNLERNILTTPFSTTLKIAL